MAIVTAETIRPMVCCVSITHCIPILFIICFPYVYDVAVDVHLEVGYWYCTRCIVIARLCTSPVCVVGQLEVLCSILVLAFWLRGRSAPAHLPLQAWDYVSLEYLRTPILDKLEALKRVLVDIVAASLGRRVVVIVVIPLLSYPWRQ